MIAIDFLHKRKKMPQLVSYQATLYSLAQTKINAAT